MVARELVAAVLGVGFGLVLIAVPELVVRAWTAGRTGPTGRHGEYGSDRTFAEKWLWVVRGLGALVALIGAGFGATLVL